MNDDASYREWTLQEAPLPLALCEAHAWRIPVKTTLYASDWSLLNEQEHSRAKAFRFDADRRRYVTARVASRTLLGSYVAEAGDRLSFLADSQGKPYLVGKRHWPDVRFNLSHSGEYVVLVFSLGTEVGVDVEQCRAGVECLELANRYFSREEILYLESVRGTEQESCFFSLWARKEACLKALGRGLGFELNGFSVVGNQDLRHVRLVHPSSSELVDIFHQTLPFIEGYQTAVACMRSQPLRVRFFTTRV